MRPKAEWAIDSEAVRARGKIVKYIFFLKRGRSSVTCTTQPPRERNDRRYGGPTPRGEYLIGNRYTNPRYNIDWYNLYPKKEDSSGYYGYTQPTRTGRYAMGLHPGRTSLGCVTVRAPTYNSDACWQRIRRVIDSGNIGNRNTQTRMKILLRLSFDNSAN